MRLVQRSVLASMLAVASALPWIGPTSAQTVPDLDCTWKGTCGQRTNPDEEQRRRRLIEEQRRKAEEDRRRADEQRKADEERRRAADEQRKTDEERRRATDEQRKTDEERRRAADEQRKADEERRRADEQRKADEERRRTDEQRRLDEERRRADEQRRLDEERRRADEQRRLDEERRRADEQRKTDEQRRADEERRRADEQRKADEERRRVEEERRRSGEDQRSADRKRQEGELLATLRRGDANDVLLFVNETTSAPNASRNPQRQVIFRDGQAAVCGVAPWTGGPEVSAAVQAVLARHGATRILTNVAETACPEIQRPYDIVAVERRLFQELSAGNVRGLLTDVLDRRLTLLEPGVTAADIAAARERLRPPLAERRRLLTPTVKPLGERLMAEVQAYIAADGRTGSIGTEFAAFGQWHGELRGASRTLAADRFDIDDYGDATGTSGSLPAASVVVWFNVTTPGRPAPIENCMVFAWLDDSATGVRREPIAFRCDAQSEIDQWKRQRGLRSKWS